MCPPAGTLFQEKRVNLLHRINQFLGYLEMGALALLTTVMFVVVFGQVIFRYVLNEPSPWTEELARYLFIWIALIGAAYGVKGQSHFGFELIVRKMPPALQRFEHVFVHACMGILVFVLTFYGMKMLRVVSFQMTPALQIPMRYVYLSLPVSGFLMSFHLICNFLKIGGKESGPKVT
jgi:TRAP-type C4-dicarboxylate transport system permease small subunit